MKLHWNTALPALALAGALLAVPAGAEEFALDVPASEQNAPAQALAPAVDALPLLTAEKSNALPAYEATAGDAAPAADVADPYAGAAPKNGWYHAPDGKDYWYENGVRQGFKPLKDGRPDPTYRGKEIYDPATKAWYWLDNVQSGAKAVSKDVYQDSKAGEWADHEDGTGKWVRYDEDGQMIKGWQTTEAGTYYFDPVYGTMAKGEVIIGSRICCFDLDSGIGFHNKWGFYAEAPNVLYWYENAVRQGVKLTDKLELDQTYRGKEIYDPATNAWYWLDNVQYGAMARGKDVYQESQADDAGNIGKWVRYNEAGQMVKGWSSNGNGAYYFDLIYGTMTKGDRNVDGFIYTFNQDTGILQGFSAPNCNTGDAATADSLFAATNYRRMENGMPPLYRMNDEMGAADLRARELAQRFSHTRPNGEICYTALTKYPDAYLVCGENIAYVGGSASNAADHFLNLWMNSPGHRSNILSPSYTSLATGVYRDPGTGYTYAVQMLLGPAE